MRDMRENLKGIVCVMHPLLIGGFVIQNKCFNVSDNGHIEMVEIDMNLILIKGA